MRLRCGRINAADAAPKVAFFVRFFNTLRGPNVEAIALRGRPRRSQIVLMTAARSRDGIRSALAVQPRCNSVVRFVRSDCARSCRIVSGVFCI